VVGAVVGVGAKGKEQMDQWVLRWLAMVAVVEGVAGWMDLLQTLTWKMKPRHWMRKAVGSLVLHVNQEMKLKKS
jgi:precorrin-6B methylase 1